MWQDYLLSIGGAFFALALVPSILSKDKPDFKTSAPTALILYVFAVVYFRLHLWLATITAFVSGLAWTILAVQKHQSNHKN
jgi:hypothetical protein